MSCCFLRFRFLPTREWFRRRLLYVDPLLSKPAHLGYRVDLLAARLQLVLDELIKCHIKIHPERDTSGQTTDLSSGCRALAACRVRPADAWQHRYP